MLPVKSALIEAGARGYVQPSRGITRVYTSDETCEPTGFLAGLETCFRQGLFTEDAKSRFYAPVNSEVRIEFLLLDFSLFLLLVVVENVKLPLGWGLWRFCLLDQLENRILVVWRTFWFDLRPLCIFI